MQVTDLMFQIPIAGQYHLTHKIIIDFGPQIGFIINKKIDITDEAFQEGEEVLYEGAELITDVEYDPFDFGLFIGLGYKLNDPIGLFTRYNLSFTERDNQIKSSIFDFGLRFNWQ
jgi:hypothetical protein